jgi:hypothetical protein
MPVAPTIKLANWPGLVGVEPHAQQRLYELRADTLKQLHDWLDRYRMIWEERFEQLDEFVEELKQDPKLDASVESKRGNDE